MVKYIELDETRELRYNYNAIADLEDKMGKGLGQILAQQNIGFSTIRALLWAGLKWNQHNLAFATVGQMLQKYLENDGSLEDVTTTILEALQDSKIIGKTEKNVETEAVTE